MNVRLPAALGVGLAVYVAAFQAIYYAQTLYNSGSNDEGRIGRLYVLERAAAPSTPREPNLYLELFEKLADWRRLADRGRILNVSTLVLAAVLATGDLVRRLVLGPGSTGRLEACVLAFGFGAPTVSLTTQLWGLFGLLSRVSAIVTGVAIGSVWLIVCARQWLSRDPDSRVGDDATEETGKLLPFAVVIACAPFVLLATLAAALPTTDYDALAYHLLGPKEYFLHGKIEFLPHNVYTTFPFLTEMFPLLGMTLAEDWFQGGIAGQVVLASFGPATATAVGLLARRLFGARAGWLAGFVYLTTPWTYRLSSIPYVEGATLFFLSAGLLAALRTDADRWRWSFSAGFFAGAAVACKYPNVVMVAMPLGVFVACRLEPRRRLWGLAAFFAGASVTAGPWLVRNWLWTGNPVYPLLFEVFGGREWSSDLADKFTRAHQPTDYKFSSMVPYAWDVLLRSDWQSPLMFCFAPLALLAKNRGQAAWLWVLLAYLFAAFWAFTHRLDRFWLPVEPIAAALAGGGMVVAAHWIGRWPVAFVGGLAVFYQLAFCASGLCGLANYTAELRRQEISNVNNFWPALRLANDPLLVDPRATVLFVGFAAVHPSTPVARYSTVFNDNLFEAIAKKPGTKDELRSPEEIRAALKSRGVGYVVVDWKWIENYRSPGNYGFTEFIQPKLFRKLIEEGVLRDELEYRGARSIPTLSLYRVLPPEPYP